MAPANYIDTITKPNTWGGAIELTIFAAYYNTEIASIDVETGRVDHFTPPALESGISPASMRCIVIYSGIHYDAASLAPMVDAPAEWHQTLFEIVSCLSINQIVIHLSTNRLFLGVQSNPTTIRIISSLLRRSSQTSFGPKRPLQM